MKITRHDSKSYVVEGFRRLGPTAYASDDERDDDKIADSVPLFLGR